jgi:hypothetical protein
MTLFSSPERRRGWLRLRVLVLLLLDLFLLLLLALLLVGLPAGVDRRVLTVVARGERRRHVLAQRHGHELRGVRIRPAVVEAPVHGIELAIGRVEEVLSLRIEHRPRVGQIAAGHAMRFSGRRVEQEDRAVGVRRRPRVGDPARVRRPAEREALEIVVGDPFRTGVEDGHLARLGLAEAHAHRLVDEHDLPAVGRPVRCVAEACAERGDLPLRAVVIRRPHGEFVLAAAVAPVGDNLAVRRPARIPLGDAGRPRDVHHRPELGRGGEDIAARLEERALPRGRNRRGPDQRFDLRHPRAKRGFVGDDSHGHLFLLAGGEVEEVEAAAGLEDDAVRPARRKRDVELGEMRDLLQTSAADVERPHVVPLVRVTVGDEIDFAAVPHRLRIVGRVLGEVPRRARTEVEQPEVGRPAAPIPLPRAEVLGHRHVNESPAVR